MRTNTEKMYNESVSTIILLLISFVIVSCSSNKIVKANIEHMKEKPVVIEEKSMTWWIPDSELYNKYDSKDKYTLVVYADSAQCSSCFINRMIEWDEILVLENSDKHDVRFLFIIEPKKGESSLLKEKLTESGFKHPVLIDQKSLFQKANPQIPKESIYHTFLLDNNNNIILVGNPLRNYDVRKLFYKRLSENKKP